MSKKTLLVEEDYDFPAQLNTPYMEIHKGKFEELRKQMRKDYSEEKRLTLDEELFNLVEEYNETMANISQYPDSAAEELEEFIREVEQFEKKLYQLTVGQQIVMTGCIFAGCLVGSVLGAVAGLAVGAFIGGGLGSVIPLFGNLGGAVMGGSITSVVGLLKGAGIGGLVGMLLGQMIVGTTVGAGSGVASLGLFSNNTKKLGGECAGDLLYYVKNPGHLSKEKAPAPSHITDDEEAASSSSESEDESSKSEDESANSKGKGQDEEADPDMKLAFI